MHADVRGALSLHAPGELQILVRCDHCTFLSPCFAATESEARFVRGVELVRCISPYRGQRANSCLHVFARALTPALHEMQHVSLRSWVKHNATALPVGYKGADSASVPSSVFQQVISSHNNVLLICRRYGTVQPANRQLVGASPNHVWQSSTRRGNVL